MKETRNEINMNFIRKNWVFLVALIIPLLSYFVISFATPWGTGVTTDTIYYVSAARNLQQGNGLIAINDDGNYEPLWRFPPVTSIVLWLTGAENSGFFLINVVCLFLLLLFSGLYVFKKTGKLWAMLVVQLLILLSHDFITIFTMGWSESIFLILMFGALVLLGEYFEQKKTLYLILSIILAGITTLTRYAGLSFGLMYVCAFLFYEWPITLRLIQKLVAILVVFVTPFIAWSIYLRYIVHGRSARNFGIHIINSAELSEGFGTVFSWISPVAINKSFLGILLLVGVSIIIYVCWKLYQNRAEVMRFFKTNIPFTMFSGFSVLYVSFIIITMSFFDELTPLDFRILAPALLGAIIAVVLYLGQQKDLQKNIMVFVAMLGILASIVYAGTNVVLLQNKEGTILADKTWSESETIAYLQTLPENIKVYTNGVAGVYVLGNHDAATLPFRIKPTLELNKLYKLEIASLGKKATKDPVYLVYFKPARYIATWHPDQKEFEEILTLELVKEFPDAIIYQIVPVLEK